MLSKKTLQNVVDEAIWRYYISGYHTDKDVIKEKLNLDLGIFIPDLKRIEYAFSEELRKKDISKLSSYRQYGYEVYVLVPINMVWKIRPRLRGKADFLKSWWQEEGKIKFGTPAVP